MNKKQIDEILDRHLAKAHAEIMAKSKFGDITPSQVHIMNSAENIIKKIMLEVFKQNN